MNSERKKKSPALVMKVNIAGKRVKEKNSTETFLEVLRILGPQTIASMKEIKVDRLPLVVPKKDYRIQMNELGGGYYACTHMPTMCKKRLLEKIAKKMNVDIRIIINKPIQV